MSLLRELPAVVCLALVLAVLVKTFLLQAFYIPTHSMESTLLVDDRVLVSKIAYRFDRPGYGDIVVFDSPLLADEGSESLPQMVVRNLLEIVGLQHPNRELTKRIVAVGGDRVAIRDNQLFVNGVRKTEHYLSAEYRMTEMPPQDVPDGHVWVMGDNRDNSRDSRWFGPISTDKVVGRVILRVWPPKR